ncbi:MAG: Crp/Fnr family transcriptional regulator [Anaerolineales bacterium]|jgi:CRP/FNR family transcriptional regulator|nr:Crp/Fnr family transcriptional regulator [Anaerolineales bacterium]
MTAIESLLAQHPVFASLEQKDLAALGALSSSRQFRKGEFVIQQGDIWPTLFLVTEGRVVAQKASAEGRSLTVTRLETGDLFWGLAFFQEELAMPVTLEAVEATRLYLWAQADLLPFLVQHGQVSWELSRLMVQRMAQASDMIETLAFQPVAGRLARFLAELAPADNSPVARSLTLDEMAAQVGSTREVVCRFLQRFANDGLINITRTEFVINSPDGLKEIARQGKG